MPADKKNYLALCIVDSKSDKCFQIAVQPWMLSSCARDLKFSVLLKKNIKIFDAKVFFKPVLRDNSDSFCKAFILNCNGYSRQYDLEVFRPLVSRLARQLLANEYVNDLTDLSFGLLVNEDSGDTDSGNNRMVLSTGLQLSLAERSLLSTIKGFDGHYRLSKKHLTVFMDKEIERLMVDYVMQDTTRERAGFLTGQLCRDPKSKNIYLLCSGHITMREIESDMDIEKNSSITHFQFNPEYFIKVNRMLSGRNNKEIIVGWYHSHPWYFEAEDKTVKEQSSLFFSQDDLQVHESAFSAPYHVGIVIGKEPGSNSKPGTQMYGWRDGRVERILYKTVNLEKNSME